MLTRDVPLPSRRDVLRWSAALPGLAGALVPARAPAAPATPAPAPGTAITALAAGARGEQGRARHHRRWSAPAQTVRGEAHESNQGKRRRSCRPGRAESACTTPLRPRPRRAP